MAEPSPATQPQGEAGDAPEQPDVVEVCDRALLNKELYEFTEGLGLTPEDQQELQASLLYMSARKMLGPEHTPAMLATAWLPHAGSLVHAAARAGNWPMLHLLLAAAPHAVDSADSHGRLPIHCAADGCSVAAVRLLLELAPDTALQRDASGMVPLLSALFSMGQQVYMKQDVDSGVAATLVSLLLEAAPEAARVPDREGTSALHFAAYFGQAPALRLVLEAWPEAVSHVNVVEGRLPLHVAGYGGSADAVAILLAASPASAEAADHYGMLPLHCAASAHVDCPAAVQLLLQAAPGAAIAATSHGILPLHLAAEHWSGSAGLGVLLAAAPEAAAVADVYGRLPLHCAAGVAGNSEHVLAVLAVAPAAAMVRDAEGWLPLEILLRRKPAAEEEEEEEDAAGARSGWFEAACRVMQHTGAHDAAAALAAAGEIDLMVALVMSCSLPKEDWQLLPSPFPGLGAALPAVLARSQAEAAQLARRLLPAERERLQSAALCLSRSFPASVYSRRILPHVLAD